MKSLILLVLLLMTDGIRALENKCDAGWEHFGEKCYNYIASNKAWADAEKHCLHFGANLASVHDNVTYNFLRTLGKNTTGNYDPTWIGGCDAAQESTWLWSDGSVFNFSLWNYNEPNNRGGAQHCVQINNGDKHLWNDHGCSNELYFVCQKPAGHRKMKLDQKPEKSLILVVYLLLTEDSHALESKCDTGWEKFGEKCYNYIASYKTWADAEKHCLSLGGNLASVHDEETHSFLQGLAKNSVRKDDPIWIGGSDSSQESTWLWSDGSVFDFSRWYHNEPNNGRGAQHCLQMNYRDLWDDRECSKKLYFVCQKPPSLRSISHGAK